MENNTDGMIIIGTAVDDKEFYKTIREMEKADVPDFEIDPKLNIQELQKEILKANAELQKYKGLNMITPEQLQNIQLLISFIDKANAKISELGGQQIIIKGLNDTDETLEKIEESARRIDLHNVETQIKNIGKSINNVAKKVVRWGLAVFGIRSAYMAVRSAMNTITQYDSQLKADIDYMKNAIAFALEPVVRKIVELMKTLMFYVAYIIKAWTGRDIFANANKSLKQANGEAKKLSKTLAGFDEMNVLNDSSSGGGGGIATPSFDLTAPEDIQPPSWLVWIADNKEIVIAGLLGIAGALIAVKLGINGIIGLGIGIAIAGIILLIRDVIKFIKDPSWSNFINVLNSLSIALIGVGIAMIAFNASNPIGWIMLAIGAIGLLVTAVVKNWGKIKETLSKAWRWIKDKFNGLPSWAKTLLKGIGNAVILVINSIIGAINAFLLPLRGAIAVIGKVIGKNWTLSSVAIPKVPYLAKGGIVNYPGKGVPVGSAITGESGREGVIPLTDSQQMALLGEAIGKYININATIPVYVANRQIAKEIRRINAEDDFAFNR